MATIKTEPSGETLFGFTLPAGSNAELIKQTILAYLSAAFLLVLFLLFVLPRFSDLAAISASVNDLQTKVNGLTKTLDALDSFKADISDENRQLAFLAIPNRFDPGLILLSLRKIASDNNVSIVSYELGGGSVTQSKTGQTQPAVQTSPNIPVRHIVKVEISGNPKDMISFIDGLNNYLPIAGVSNLSISEVSKIFAQGEQNSKLSMDLTYYHLPGFVAPGTDISGQLLTDKEIASLKSLLNYSRLTGGIVATPSGTGKENLFGI